MDKLDFVILEKEHGDSEDSCRLFVSRKHLAYIRDYLAQTFPVYVIETDMQGFQRLVQVQPQIEGE